MILSQLKNQNIRLGTILNKFFLMIVVIIIAISCQKVAYTDLGSEYKLINSASFDDLTIVTKDNIVLISGDILDDSFNSDFVIASQRPRDSFLVIKTMSNDDYNDSFEKSKIRKYWIINKKIALIYDTITYKHSNVYGPYNHDEYLSKRIELKIPSNLHLDK